MSYLLNPRQYIWRLEKLTAGYTMTCPAGIASPIENYLSTASSYLRFFKGTFIPIAGLMYNHSVLFGTTSGYFTLSPYGSDISWHLLGSNVNFLSVAVTDGRYGVCRYDNVGNQYLVSIWDLEEDQSGEASIISRGANISTSGIVTHCRFINRNQIAVLASSSNSCQIIYYQYTAGRPPGFLSPDAVIEGTNSMMNKMYFFNDKIAIIGDTQYIIGTGARNPSDIQIFDLPSRFLRVKVLYDHLFFITGNEVRWTNNGIDWKRVYYTPLYDGDNDAITCFSADGKVYVNKGLFTNVTGPSTLFCADINH
jgi:hypothetical protein